MEAEFESRVLREIEEEVQSILRKSKGIERKADSLTRQKISYYRLLRGDVIEEVSRKVKDGEIVLFSFNGDSAEEVKSVVSRLREHVQELGGEMYLIRRPTVLVVPRDTELRVHG